MVTLDTPGVKRYTLGAGQARHGDRGKDSHGDPEGGRTSPDPPARRLLPAPGRARVRWARRPLRPDGARARPGAEVAHEGRDARGDRGVSVAPRAARDPGRDLHRLSPWWGLGRVGRRVGFILPNFVIVAVLGALYVHFGGLPWVTAVFYGVSPAVIALILYSCHRLAKLGMEDWLQWVIAAASFAITVVLQAEVALLFIGAGILGILYYRSRVPGRAASLPVVLLASLVAGPAAGAAPASGGATLGKLLVFFLKAGSLTFGSGLVIVPFLETGLVHQTGWLDERQFLVAVAMGMLSPGPVVITATFVGYLVAGFWGAAVSTVGIFLPSFLLVLIVAPVLVRHRANPNVQGFVRGAYAAAIGTILGACVLLGRIAIGDWLTALVGLASLGVLFRWKVSNPALIAATALIGLIAFPLLRPTWVFVK
ncbi:MAG: chromate transporter [Candidatus Rokuibacteriota bacterium]|nr:MAG: chromate transporter [Candidatus Rokubacteria bacterium]